MQADKVESGIQLFSRLNQKSTLENLNPDLFPDGPHTGEVIEISGKSMSGKTLLVTDLLARCVLPEHYKNIKLGGKNTGAVIINTDHHFNLFKLINVMENRIKTCLNGNDTISTSEIQSVVHDSLNKLIVLSCYDSFQLQTTFYNLERIICENNCISFVAIDSLSAHYWSDRNHTGVISVQTYCLKMLDLLHDCVQSYKICILYTKTEVDNLNYAKISKNDCNLQYRILLKSDNNENVAIISDLIKNQRKVLKFTKQLCIEFLS